MHTFRTSMAGLLLAGMAAMAAAQGAYPDKPVQVIVPWAAGGSVDTMGRALTGAMGRVLGQSFVVANRDGAGGMVGTAVVANAPADGYMLTFGPITPITNAAQLLRKPAFNTDSFEYVCQVFENRFGIAVPQASPYKTMQELLDAMKAEPDKISYGHLGNGSISHLSFETAVQGKGLKYTGIPYRGEVPLFVELMANRVDVGIVTVGGALMGSRPVRFLAVIGEARHPGVPEVPTLKELGLPTLLPALNGLMAPKGTPPAVLQKLEGACREATESEEMKRATASLREQVLYLPGSQFAERTRRDYAEKGALIKRLNLMTE
ncbi:MAG: tripartite tricarboxylate transporter substrate binding protein [Burkholderiaceae bacterium]|nr:tripartite tricarboxylate transporter substrate binding protein [Burkholderiaceae bacterium]